MCRSSGFRTDLTRTQARHVSKIRDSQRFAYNWAVERLRADPTLTRCDPNKEFTKLRRNTPHLRYILNPPPSGPAFPDHVGTTV